MTKEQGDRNGERRKTFSWFDTRKTSRRSHWQTSMEPGLTASVSVTVAPEHTAMVGLSGSPLSAQGFPLFSRTT